MASEAEKVLLYGQQPPIVKMDGTLGTLKAAKHLALSSNNIEKISGLKGLEQLEILSLGRNCVKKLDGLDDVSGTLKELWISYNLIDKLNGMEKLTNLVTLYMRSCPVKRLLLIYCQLSVNPLLGFTRCCLVLRGLFPTRESEERKRRSQHI